MLPTIFSHRPPLYNLDQNSSAKIYFLLENLQTSEPCIGVLEKLQCSGGFRGAQGAPPLGAQILSISCSFRENLAKSYVGAPPPRGVGAPTGEILDPPLQCTCIVKPLQMSDSLMFLQGA